MFHFHKWSEWVVRETGKVMDFFYTSKQIGTYITQDRYCHKCHKTQIRLQKTTMLSSVILIPDSKKTTPAHDKVH